MRRPVYLFAALSAAAASLSLFVSRDARACGGCFHEPPPPGQVESVITDHRMILAVSPQQTTLYDEVRYQGNPASFAWVLPITGTVTIGLSADALFSALDNATHTIIQPPAQNCPPPPQNFCGGLAGNAAPAAADAALAVPPPVTVTHQQVVGPYQTVQLHSTDPNALNNWLTSNGYVIPADVQPIISAYVTGGFDFLAMKLVPGAGVSAMRPVRVTSTGAAPVLPLRMVAAGTGATVGVTLWVVSQGIYEPQNFPTFQIADSEIVWDYATSSSNYTTLMQQKEQALGGRGWLLESALSVPPQQIESALAQSEGGYYDGTQIVGGDATVDYSATTAPDGGVGETAEQVRSDDMATLFQGSVGSVRISRMRSDLAHAALDQDLTLQASTSQTPIPNYHYVTNTVNAPPCPTYPPAAPCPSDNPPGGSLTPTGGGTVGHDTTSFSCALSRAGDAGAPVAVLGVAALVGLGASRSRRRRRRSE
jgi:hypothetical protein